MALQSIRTGFLDAFFSTITHLGDAGIFWIVLTAVCLCTKKYRNAGIAMACALLFGVLVTNITLKPLIGRARPYEVAPGVELLVARPSDASFPSGHATASFAAATALMLYRKREGACALALAGIIAFSRMYLYLHFPTDILAGAIIGICGAFLGRTLQRRIPLLARCSNNTDESQSSG